MAKGQRFYRIDLKRLNDPDRLAVLESLSQKWAQVVSESRSWASQHEPVEINNTELCCDAEPTSLAIGDQLGESVEVASPQHSYSLQESVEQKSVQVSSENAFEGSQQSPVEINNNGHCCGPQPQFQTATDPLEFPDGLIPEEHRQGVLDIEAWLTDAAQETPETLQAILDVAVEYLRLVPQAKAWLPKVMKTWVKETIWQLFPDYYRALASP